VEEKAEVSELNSDPGGVPRIGLGSISSAKADESLEARGQHQSQEEHGQRPESDILQGGGKELGQHDHDG
jgi:hypothetical protein